jgi:hypothetical protein
MLSLIGDRSSAIAIGELVIGDGDWLLAIGNGDRLWANAHVTRRRSRR